MLLAQFHILKKPRSNQANKIKDLVHTFAAPTLILLPEIFLKNEQKSDNVSRVVLMLIIATHVAPASINSTIYTYAD